ncbi:MAG TPA: class I SAM-dependent methyltransferase [Nitrosopumilaceae archaeon]|nr:class I SAM-dependent methyltransferase [Nitrosopumilaceae archaeon]
MRVYLANLIAQGYFEYLKSKAQFKTALDIGARYGNLVKIMEDSGIQAEGIEADQNTIQYAISDKIKWALFSEQYETDKKYDLICLTQMIFYLPNTLEVLRKVLSMLNPHGFIFISTYNPDSHFREEYQENIRLKTDYQEICKHLDMEILDYSGYQFNYSIDFADKGKTEKIMGFLKYRLGKKKIFIPDPKGFCAFILLRNKIQE